MQYETDHSYEPQGKPFIKAHNEISSLPGDYKSTE